MYDRDKKRRFIDISDEEIQKKMEASVGFGVYFSIDTDYYDTEAEIQQSEPVTEVKNVKEVETLAEAKKLLTEYGVKTYPAMNKAKAIDAAKTKGIELIIKN